MLANIITVALKAPFTPTFLLLFLPFFVRIVQTYWRRYLIARSHGCESAKSKASLKDPFVGFDFVYDILFGKTPERYLDNAWKTFQQLGSTYTVKRWTWETVYTCDARNVKQMLATGFQDFDLPRIRVSAMTPMFGNGIFTLTGHSWAQTRAVLRRCFSKAKMASLNKILEAHFQALLQHIPADGDEVDLQPLFFGLTMDIATEFLMGHSTKVLDARGPTADAQRFVDDYMACSAEVVHQMQLGPLRHFRTNPEADAAKKRVFDFVDAFLDEALGRSAGECNLISEFKAVAGDTKQLRDQVLHVLLASRDTTAGLLSNLFFVLAKHPAIYAKLRDDVLAVAGHAAPSTAQLRQMEYLKACVSESLRLHPVVPTNAREALRDTSLPRGGGKDGKSPFFVAKGTVVLYNVYSMHRDVTVFGAKPEEFVPERWRRIRPGWAYLPFNGGPRVCIGQQFALLECYYIIARIVQTFSHLESREEGDWVEHYALALSSRKGTRVVLNKSG